MIAVITGDIIHSRKASHPEMWMGPLKKVLSRAGKTPRNWEIYRGDSFQLEVELPGALKTAVHIKASMRSLGTLDARMAIGIGEKSYDGTSISESAGDAFVNSGHAFEQLKELKRNLIIKSRDKAFDREMNMMFRLALVIMDHWTDSSAELMRLILENPDSSQKELGRQLGIRQSSVSERYGRGYIREILALDTYYRSRIDELLVEN